MKRLMKYYREKKGITLVLIALMLAVLLFFLGMAVDISYMYHVKNQLQVAADAAALAGASQLSSAIDDGTSATFGQLPARREAWKFACRNRATNQSVFLVTNSSTDCDAPPASGLNETSNTSPGDIVVGNWNSTTRTFTPANNGGTSTGLPINALQARPQMTGETPGMPKARVFIGQVFRLIGIDWSRMSARASAIASFTPPQIGPFPVCLPSCSMNTPLDGQWDYDKTLDDPILCTDANGSPPGQLFVFESSSETEPKKPALAWTNFVTRDCGQNCDMPNWTEVLPYLQGAPTPDICNKNICTTNGTIANLFDDLQTAFDKNKKPYPFSVSGTTITITGWNMLVPVVSDTTCGVPNSACPGAQNGKANPYYVSQYANVLITEVIKPKGIRFVGLDNPRPFNQTVTCKGGPHPTIITVNRMVTSIAASGVCADCQSPPSTSGGTRAHLVK